VKQASGQANVTGRVADTDPGTGIGCLFDRIIFFIA
jgi:hypothetical protein